GMARPEARVTPQDRNDLRLVFLMSPGPGGGGGGGGLKQPAPPPPAERKGTARLRSPVPAPKPPPKVDPPPPPKPEPEVVAPVVQIAADPRDRAGVPWTPKEVPAPRSRAMVRAR